MLVRTRRSITAQAGFLVPFLPLLRSAARHCAPWLDGLLSSSAESYSSWLGWALSFATHSGDF